MKTIQKSLQMFLIAAIALASFGAIPSKTDALTPVAVQCVSLGSNFGIGNFDIYAGGQVNALQTYLYQSGYMTRTPTGYYGAITANAVANFQRANGILATGYVGPLTRARLQQLTCGTIPSPLSISSISPAAGTVGTLAYINGYGFNSNSTVSFGGATIGASFVSAVGGNGGVLSFTIPQYITPCAPNANCIQLAQQVMPGTYPVYVRNYDGTVSNSVNFTVTSSGSNQQFSIAGVDAPSTLTYNNTGTWTIRVNNTGGTLRYSVIWGDEPYYTSGNQIMAPSQNYQSSATFTHAYNRTGTFNPTFTVTDDAGRTATISTSVLVTPIY